MKKESNTDKAIRLKPEFDQLSYSDKLKFMDDHFGGCSGIGDQQKGKMIISIYPDSQNKEEIRLFNERMIKRYENFKDDLFIEYSFERLKQRYDNQILKIRKLNLHPKNLIKDYTQEQIDLYSQRMTDNLIKKTKNYYKGNWDLSKKIIDTSFLQARAWENYIGFLQSKINRAGYEPKGFDNLFKDSKIALQIKDLLENNGFTKNGIWNFDNIKGTKNKTCLVALYHVLKPLLKTTFQNKLTPVVKEFYKEFGIEGLIDDRSMRNLPPLKDQEIFKKLFKYILLK